MKILSLISPSPFSPLSNDAMYWRIWNIRRLLQADGHEVDLVCYTPRCLYKKINDEYLKQEVSFRLTALPNLHYLKDINKYDLIYANTAWSGFNSLLGKLNRHPPVIVDMHGLLYEEYLIQKANNKISTVFSSGIRKLADITSLKFSNKIICVSNKMIDYLCINRGVPLHKVDHIANGVDLDFFKASCNSNVDELRDKLNLANKMVFGYLGEFQKWQGVENFISAASKIKSKDVAFIIVGTNYPYHVNSNIQYIPRVPRQLTPYYYSLCDVLVLPRPSYPATEVAAPTKFAEYVSMSKPVLTTNVGDAADLVRDYECGIVIENNDINNISHGIKTFSGMSIAELRTMGENSRKLAINEFDWEKQRYKLRHCIEKTFDV